MISRETKCDEGQCPNTLKPSYKAIDDASIECDKCDPNKNDPICCHGIEYIDTEKYHKGECGKDDNSCLCTKESDSICCNGKEYTNPCNAECDGVTKPAEMYCQFGPC